MAKRRQNRPPRVPRPVIASGDRDRGGRVARATTRPMAEVPSAPLGRWTLTATTVVALTALLLYLRTLSQSLPTGDSGELLTDAWVLGIAHPPGYPTFTMLTAVAERLTPHNPALGGNVLSAILHAGAVALVGLAIARLPMTLSDAAPSGSDAASLRWARIGGIVAGAGLLAVSTAFWAYALVAEVFPLNSILAAALVLLMLEWRRSPHRIRLLWLAAFLSGLALTNQHTIILLAPGLFILYGAGLRRAAALARAGPAAADRIVRTMLVPAGLGIIGLLPYVYLPIAAAGDPPMNWGDPRTLDRFLEVVLRQSYGTFRLVASDAQGTIVDQLRFLGTYLVSAVSPVGVALAALGFGWLLRVRRVEGAALLAMFLVAGPGFVAFANPPIDDPVIRGILERFYILPTIPVAIAAGAGAMATIAWLHGRLAARAAERAVLAARPSLLAVAAAALVIAIAVPRFGSADRSKDRTAINYAEDILAPLEPGALLLMRGDEHFTSLRYGQLVIGLRPDVTAVEVELLKLPAEVSRLRRAYPDLEIPWRVYDDGKEASLRDLIAANIGARAVYVVGELKEELEPAYDELHVGLARQIVPAGSADKAAAALVGTAVLTTLNPPATTWPDSTWEFVISANYGEFAFELAADRQVAEAQSEWGELAALYRTAIERAPYLDGAFKNLGLLLLNNDGDKAEMIRLWTRFLELSPDDPEAGAIRAEVERLNAELR